MNEEQLRRLSNFMEMYQEDEVDEIYNRNVIHKYKQPGNLYHIQVCNKKKLVPFQIIPNNTDAVELDKPTAGHITDKLKASTIHIKRELIGLHMAIRMSEDYYKFKEVMDTFSKIHSEQLKEQLGFSYASSDLYGNFYMTYLRPSAMGHVTLMQDYAAVEIRCMSDVVHQPFFIEE